MSTEFLLKILFLYRSVVSDLRYAIVHEFMQVEAEIIVVLTKNEEMIKQQNVMFL